MLKRRFLHVFLNYLVVLFSVFMYFFFYADFIFESWEYILSEFKTSAIIAFFITLGMTLFEYTYYTSRNINQKFSLRIGETVLGTHNALQIRGFLPVFGKIILTSERLFFNLKNQGFSLWYNQIDSLEYRKPVPWLFSETTLHFYIKGKSEHRESFIIEDWKPFEENIHAFCPLERNSLFSGMNILSFAYDLILESHFLGYIANYLTRLLYPKSFCYNNTPLSQTFDLWESEVLVGVYKAYQMRSEEPVFGKILITSKRFFFMIDSEKGFSIWYNQIKGTKLLKVKASTDVALQIISVSDHKRKEIFIIQEWHDFKKQCLPFLPINSD